MKSTLNLNTINNLLFWLLISSTASMTLVLAIPYHPYRYLIVMICFLFLIQLLKINEIKLGSKIIYIIFFFQICFIVFSYYYFNYYSPYLNMLVQIVLTGVVYICLNNIFDKYKIIKTYFWFISIMGILGAIAFLLGILGFLEPYSVYQNIDGRNGYNFILTFSNSVFFLGDRVLIKVAGYFDEPGTFAFYIIFALLLNKISFNNKKWELVLIFSGLFTLSMAYYIILGFYYLFFYYMNKKTIIISVIRNILVFLFLFAIIAGINYFSSESPVISQINQITIERFRAAEGDPGRFVIGDNRSRLVKLALEAFTDSPFMGHGASYYKNPDSSYYERWFGANLFEPLGTFGIIGTIFLYLHVFYLFYIMIVKIGRYNSDYIKICILIFITYLQRPHALGLLNYFLILLFVELSITYYRSIKRKFKLCEPDITPNILPRNKREETKV